MLEAMQHTDNCFITLTYDDEHLPLDLSLKPRDLQLFVKRLRRQVEPSTFRFYAVGEYGEENHRPHYHAGLFGFPGCQHGRSRYRLGVANCCYWCDMVRDTWGRGYIDVGNLEPDSAQYLAGYVTKKMTSKSDPRLNGRHPEYARMSLRPGVGAEAMLQVASVLLQYGQDDAADVPLALAHGRKELPLGRYLRRKLREAMGKDGKISQEAMDQLSEQMFAVRLAARSDSEDPSVLSHLKKSMDQKVRNFEARQQIFKDKDKRL